MTTLCLSSCYTIVCAEFRVRTYMLPFLRNVQNRDVLQALDTLFLLLEYFHKYFPELT